jgi:hypothetical protein
VLRTPDDPEACNDDNGNFDVSQQAMDSYAIAMLAMAVSMNCASFDY